MNDATARYSADELWAQYDVESTVPSLEPFRLANEAKTNEMKAALTCHADVAYGPSALEKMDIYPAPPKPGIASPALIFIHGGYWRFGSKNATGYMAKAFTDRGVAVASIDYGLAPDVRLDDIVAQARAAAAFVYNNADKYGIDRDKLHVAGTSAGGHLTAMVVAGGWHEAAGVPEDLIKGACTVSGLFDLEPLLGIEPNTWLNLDKEGARRNSPVRLAPANNHPVVIGYGADETDEFKRQSDIYADSLRKRGVPVSVFELTGKNHFSISQTLAEPDGLLTQQILGMIEV